MSDGYLENGLRALTGCPVFNYKTSDTTDLAAWNYLHTIDRVGTFFMGAQTDKPGTTAGTKNTYGVKN